MSEGLFQEREEILISSPHFRITFFTCPLVVAFVPLASVPRCAWWLLREFSSSHPLSTSTTSNKDPQSTVKSILLDDEGLTIVFPLSRLGSLPSLLSKEDLTILCSLDDKNKKSNENNQNIKVDNNENNNEKIVSSVSFQQLLSSSINHDSSFNNSAASSSTAIPTTSSSSIDETPTVSDTFSWRAFTVRMSGPSFDTPQVILSLTQALSQNNISILHISTFEAEIYLIPRNKIDIVKKILKNFYNVLVKRNNNDYNNFIIKVDEDDEDEELIEDKLDISDEDISLGENSLDKENENDLELKNSTIEYCVGMNIDDDDEFLSCSKEPSFELTIENDSNETEKEIENIEQVQVQEIEKNQIEEKEKEIEISDETTSSSPTTPEDVLNNHISYPSLSSSVSEEAVEEEEEEESDEDDLDTNWITSDVNNFHSTSPSPPLNPPPINTSTSSCSSSANYNIESKFQSDYQLSILPHPVILATLTHPKYYSLCTQIMVNILLYDERFSVLERECQKIEEMNRKNLDKDKSQNNSSSSSSNSNYHSRFLWGIWQCGEEVTFLLEECDLSLFPVDVLLLSPIQWRVIKLCGPAIEGSECGVVAAMMRPLTSYYDDVSSAASSYSNLSHLHNSLSHPKTPSSFINSSNKLLSNNFSTNSLTNNSNISCNNNKLSASMASISTSLSNCLESSMSNNYNLNSSLDHNFNNFSSDSIPSLNISTAITNSTLVPEELLYQTVDKLCLSLNCQAYFPPIC